MILLFLSETFAAEGKATQVGRRKEHNAMALKGGKAPEDDR